MTVNIDVTEAEIDVNMSTYPALPSRATGVCNPCSWSILSVARDGVSQVQTIFFHTENLNSGHAALIKINPSSFAGTKGACKAEAQVQKGSDKLLHCSDVLWHRAETYVLLVLDIVYSYMTLMLFFGLFHCFSIVCGAPYLTYTVPWLKRSAH